MIGSHPRVHHPCGHGIVVAGIVFAGEEEQLEELALTRPGRDATVITIAEIIPPPADSLSRAPVVKVLEHYALTGKKHSELYPQLVDILKNVWSCSRVVCDSTGIGEPVTSFLRKSLGSRVVAFNFTQKSKSQLGFDLLAAVNSGRIKLYKQDSSEEYKELMFELEKAKSVYRPNQTLSFFVDPSEGHDDFLMSLAARAATEYVPRKAIGQAPIP